MLRLLLLAAAPPPAPPDHAWASPFTEFLWQVEEGPSSAKRWTALPREPRREAKSGPEAGRPPGPLENGPPRTDHLERTNPAVETDTVSALASRPRPPICARGKAACTWPPSRMIERRCAGELST